MFCSSSLPFLCQSQLSKHTLEGESNFFSGITLRESPRVLDLCVGLGDISLQGLTPKEGEPGWG